MIFNLFRNKCEDALDTGTYADGVFERPAMDLTAASRRIRGHIAHQRDYGAERKIVEFPLGIV